MHIVVRHEIQSAVSCYSGRIVDIPRIVMYVLAVEHFSAELIYIRSLNMYNTNIKCIKIMINFIVFEASGIEPEPFDVISNALPVSYTP